MKTAAMRWASLSPGFRILFLLGILISFAGYTFAEDDLYDYFRLEKEIAIDPFCVDPPLGSCNEITQNRDGILFMGFFPSQRLLSFTPEGKPLNIFTGKYEAGKRNPYLIANDPFFCEEEGYIVVSDFFNRRVMYFNLNAKLKDSFIANADKLYDLTQTVHFRDYVLVGGMALDFIQEKPLLWNGWYLHVFDRNGKYLKSLFEAYPEMVKNNRFRNNGGLVAVAGDRIYCAQTCHYLISIYDQNFEPVTIFGEKPPNWEGANVPEYPDPQQTYDNLIHSRMEHLYVLGDRVVYIYTTMNYNESRHLDYPRFCIYTLDGEPIAKGIPIDFGYYPDHFFCTSYGINSEKDRLILVKKENPENEDSLHKVGIFKPTWTLE